MQDRYVQAMDKLKDDRSPKVCVNLTGNSQSEGITKHLPIQNHTIIVQYIQKGQPYMQAIFSDESSKDRNENASVSTEFC
ncbi:unnamed protein product [Urochloa humidicola]